MRTELIEWFAHEGLLLTSVLSSPEGVADDEIKVTVKTPVVALSRASHDFRECPDPVLFGYPVDCLEMMTLDDLHQFVLSWFDRAVAAGLARCFVCNRVLDNSGEKPWDAVFISDLMYCWLLVHFDCKRYLNRDLKGRNPFEVVAQSPEFFDLV